MFDFQEGSAFVIHIFSQFWPLTYRVARKIFNHLNFIGTVSKEKNQCIREKTVAPEHSKGNKTVPEKVATTLTEDGYKQNTKTSTTI